MQFFETISKMLSQITGINDIYIKLSIYTILLFLILDLTTLSLKAINNNVNKNEKKRYLFNKKTKLIKIIIALIITAFIWSEQLHSILTLISLLTAAIAFALREIILNFFAGIYISISKPFKIEDRIEIDGITGDVVNISTMKFEILEVSEKENGAQSTGVIIQIPNSKIFMVPTKNYTKGFKYIWSELIVKLDHESDLEKSKKILYDIVKNNDIVKTIPKKMKSELNNVIGDYRIYYNNLEPIIYTKLTDECIILSIRYLAHPKKARNIENEIWNQIYKEAKKSNLILFIKNTQ